MRSLTHTPAVLVLCALLTGCPSDPGTSGDLDAGPDQAAFPCAVVQLEGDGAGEVTWAQVSGPGEAEISDVASLTPTVSSNIEGTYVFSITDDAGASDEVTVDLYFRVDTEADLVDAEDDVVSLREAVDAAQACAGPHTIHLDVDAVTLDATLAVEDALGAGDNDLSIEGLEGRTGLTGAGPLLSLSDVNLSIRAVNVSDVSTDEIGGVVVDVATPHRLHLEDMDLVNIVTTTGLYGGAIWLDAEGAELEMVDVNGRDNSTTEDGSVVGSGEFVTVSVQGGSFENNSARWGGVFAVTGDLDITGSTFTANHAERGGAVHALDGRTVIVDSTFDSNTNTTLGGALYMENFGTAEDGELEISGSTFTNNGGGTSGGAIVIDDYVEASIIDSDFMGNHVSDALADGGAIANGGQLTLSGCTFTDNRADGMPDDGLSASGGAIDSGGLTNESFIDATDCVFENNTAEEGGAVYAVFDAQDDFEDCTFTGNSAERHGGALTLSPIGHATLSNAVISNNVAQLDGGGIDFSGTNRDSTTNNSNLFLQGTTSISGNSAEFGAGVYSLIGDVILSPGASITGNNATGESSLGVGGGVCNNGGYVEGGEVSGNSPDQVCDEDSRL